MSILNPIVVDMEVEVSDIVVDMEVETIFTSPLELKSLEATKNNTTYIAPKGSAYNEVRTNVPGPEGSVTLPENGSYDVTEYAEAIVSVPEVMIESLSVNQNGSYIPEEGKAFGHVIVNVPNPSSGTIEINENGTYDVTEKAEAVVDVPNSYTADDEGKVVSDGALVAQTARTVEANGTFDTTLNNSVTVDVPVISNPFEYVKVVNISSDVYMMDENGERVVEISAPNATEIAGLNRVTTDSLSGKLTFVISIPNQIATQSNFFRVLNYSNIQYYFNFPQGLRYSGTPYNFYDIKNVVEIIGEIDMSGASAIGASCMQRPTSLRKIFFKPNSAKVMFSFNEWGGAPLLEDESIISIANGLNEFVTGQTLVLHATPKARCSAIVGTVAMDNTNTYHVFTADAGGTVTLADFITQTKGWTLA